MKPGFVDRVVVAAQIRVGAVALAVWWQRPMC